MIVGRNGCSTGGDDEKMERECSNWERKLVFVPRACGVGGFRLAR